MDDRIIFFAAWIFIGCLYGIWFDLYFKGKIKLFDILASSLVWIVLIAYTVSDWEALYAIKNNEDVEWIDNEGGVSIPVISKKK